MITKGKARLRECLLMFIQPRINQECVPTYTRSFAERPSPEEGPFYRNLKKASIVAVISTIKPIE
jgi:hypothetical protein